MTARSRGNGISGRLGYGDQRSIGDDESPGGVGPVDIGAGRSAVAISAGDFHTCVIRDDGALLCWGFGSGGQLGYGGTADYNGERQEGFGAMHMTVKDGVRWSTANAYLKPARPVKLPAAVAAKFLPDSEYARAKPVDYAAMEKVQKGFADRYLAEVR